VTTPAPIILPPCAAGQTFGQCVDSTVTAYLSASGAPAGSSCAIVSIQYAGATIYGQGYGAVSPNGAAPTPANSFQIDSLTKAFTAFAVMRLVDLGVIADVADPIGKYMTALPGVGGWNSDWTPIQISQLLAMVSGIPDSSSSTLTYLEQLEQVRRAKLQFAPGSEYQYSNSNFFLLSALIDSLVGPSSSYADYVTEQVLTPFGLASTGLIVQSAAANPVAPNFGGGVWRNPDCGYGSGGFASTMADLANFAQGLAQGLVLSGSEYKAMWTPYPLPEGDGPFGLGWDVLLGPSGNLARVEKNGGGWGWSSLVAFAPAGGGLGNAQAASVCVLLNYGPTAGAGSSVLANNLLRKAIAANR
jgi:CubicO group peptidase (beta-lactamase class C family)